MGALWELPSAPMGAPAEPGVPWGALRAGLAGEPCREAPWGEPLYEAREGALPLCR